MVSCFTCWNIYKSLTLLLLYLMIRYSLCESYFKFDKIKTSKGAHPCGLIHEVDTWKVNATLKLMNKELTLYNDYLQIQTSNEKVVCNLSLISCSTNHTEQCFCASQTNVPNATIWYLRINSVANVNMSQALLKGNLTGKGKAISPLIKTVDAPSLPIIFIPTKILINKHSITAATNKVLFEHSNTTSQAMEFCVHNLVKPFELSFKNREGKKVTDREECINGTLIGEESAIMKFAERTACQRNATLNFEYNQPNFFEGKVLQILIGTSIVAGVVLIAMAAYFYRHLTSAGMTTAYNTWYFEHSARYNEAVARSSERSESIRSKYKAYRASLAGSTTSGATFRSPPSTSMTPRRTPAPRPRGGAAAVKASQLDVHQEPEVTASRVKIVKIKSPTKSIPASPAESKNNSKNLSIGPSTPKST